MVDVDGGAGAGADDVLDVEAVAGGARHSSEESKALSGAVLLGVRLDVTSHEGRRRRPGPRRK
jgi:hypothetical protein